MPEDEPTAGPTTSSGSSGPTSEADWQRRRRLAAIFGDVLPDTTSDERGSDGAGTAEDSPSEAWLKAQVPPHHGG